MITVCGAFEGGSGQWRECDVYGVEGMFVSNDLMRSELGEVLALVREQMSDLSNVQQQRSSLVATASVAGGLVEVTVDAQRMVTRTVVHESYLDEHEFSELGGHVTSAARAAVRALDQRAQALLAPMNDRRKAVSHIAGNVIDVPGVREALAEVSAMGDALNPQSETVENHDVDRGDGSLFPTVRG
jgi:DNA-binding protein YbaB